MSNSVEGGRYLLSILDKGVASLISAELDTIVAREVDAVQSNNNTSLAAILYQPPEYFVFGLAIILLLFFTAVMPAVRTHNQHKLKKRSGSGYEESGEQDAGAFKCAAGCG